MSTRYTVSAPLYGNSHHSTSYITMPRPADALTVAKAWYGYHDFYTFAQIDERTVSVTLNADRPAVFESDRQPRILTIEQEA